MARKVFNQETQVWDTYPDLPRVKLTPEQVLLDARSRMTCTSLQGKIALGSDAWTKVLSYRDEPETPFSVKVTIDDSPKWNRLSQDISLIGWALYYTDEQMDELFVKAMKIKGE